MSLDADTIVDRRRMRRKLTFWRVFAVFIAIGALVAVAAVLRAPGTEGCIGITSDVADCHDHLEAMLSDPAANRTLVVVRSEDKQLTNLALALLKSVVTD